MSDDRVQQIIERYDKTLAGAENATIARINAALDASYKRLEKELLKAYQKHANNASLLPNQRKLLILDEVKQYLSLINPVQQQQYEQAFQALIQQASEMGIDLSGQLTQAIANETLQTFAAVPLDAVRFQAQESAKRLYRWSEDYQQKISGVVEMHLAVGSGSRKVARALRTELGILKGRAETVARTEVLSSLNQAAQASYKANGIEYVQWIATVSDRRTCPLCSSRNGNVYKLGLVTIPAHPRCRCYTLPYRQSWAELGLTNDEWMREYHREGIKELKEAGKKPDRGMSPFEKMNGLTEPPKPIWNPES